MALEYDSVPSNEHQNVGEKAKSQKFALHWRDSFFLEKKLNVLSRKRLALCRSHV